MNIADQIAFIDELVSHASVAEELEALGAIRDSLVSLKDGPKRGHTSKRTANPKIKLLRYQEFVGVYDQHCRNVLGAPGVVDARQGLALKETVVYLKKQERVAGDEDKALEAWKYIFDNWSLLSDFIARQTQLTDIKRNIQEILFQLKNASKEAKRRKSDKGWDQYGKLRKDS